MRQFITIVCVLVAVGMSAVTSLAADVAARRALNNSLPDIRFDNVALSDALEFLRDVSGANIHVNWRALEATGIGKDTTINVRLRAVPLRKVLRTVLNEAGSGNLLTYYVDENIIEVTTRELADQQLFTKVYPVDDLLVEVPDFIGPSFDISTASTAGRGSAGGTSPIRDSGNQQNVQTLTRTERAQQLIDTLQAVIQPEIWNTAGGPAAIRIWNGSLIVTAPRSVHEALSGSSAD